MSEVLPPRSAGERLETWKEIAAYLKRDVRTARRWEKLEGLPVHRHVHHKLATVYAFKPELDNWRANREATATVEDAVDAALDAAPAPTPRPLSTTRIALAAVVVVAAAATLMVVRSGAGRAGPTAALPAARPVTGRLLASATGEGQHPTIVARSRDLTAFVISPDSAHVYFTDRDRRVLRVLDTGANRISGEIQLAGRPGPVVLSPDGRLAYIGTEEGDIVRVDLRRQTFDTIARGLATMNDFALTADGTRLYITAVYNGLHVLDTRSRDLRAIPTVQCPMNVAVVPGKDLAYISYQCGGPGGRSGHDAIDVRVASTGAARTTISGPPQVGGEIRASPDSGQVWIDGKDACWSIDYDQVGCPKTPASLVNVFRVDDNYLLGSIALPGVAAPGGMSFFPDASRAVLGGSTLKVIDTRTLSIVEEAPIAATGRAVFTADRSRAYVALSNDGAIGVFDLDRDRCAPPPTDLVAWWTGDGHANDVREDNPGKLRSGAAFSPGWVGQAFHLDGRSSYVHMSNVSSVEHVGGLSAAVWIKPASSGRSETIFDHGEAGTGGWKLVRNADATLSVCDFDTDEGDCDPARTARSTAVAPAGRWTHVAAVSSERRFALFVQAESAGAGDLGAKRPVHRLDFRIGGSFDDRHFFEGLVDEVQLFRQALSVEEVRRLYNAGRHGLCYR